MKYLVCLFLMYSISLQATAQEETFKYATGLKGGLMYTLGAKGPRGKTEVADQIKFLMPYGYSFGGHFDLRVHPRHYIGIELMRDEYDYGYQVPDYFNNAGARVSGSDALANDYVYLYKAGLRWVYQLVQTRRFLINTALIPSVGYYAELDGLKDTASANSYIYSLTDREIIYISYPPYQEQGFYPVLKGSVELVYKFNRHLGISFDMNYQQGFKSFVIDTVNIVRSNDPGGIKQHKYWTKVNGTSMQFHFGLRYEFGSRR